MAFHARHHQPEPTRAPRWSVRPGDRMRRTKPPHVRPAVEQLEGRVLLATVNWIGSSGDWNTVSNWSDGTTNRLPGPDDDAVIDVAGAITVTHSSGSHTVQSLTVNEGFTLSGGTIRVTETLEIQDGNTFALAGGTISNTRVATLGSAKLIVADSSSGTLDAVTLAGTLDRTVGGGGLFVTNGLTLEDALIAIAGGRTVSLNGTQTLGGTGTVLFADNNVFNALVVIGGNPTIGPNITIHGAVGSVAGSFTNQATITADGSGSQITVIGTWVNQGIIKATGSSTLTLNGTWSNTGTIEMVDSTINLGGAFSLSGLGAFSRSGGTVNLRGTLGNDGTLALDDSTGSWVFQGGTISGGRVTLAGSANLPVDTSSSGTLSGVTLAGTLDRSIGGGQLVVTNGLTLEDAVIRIAGGRTVSLNGTQTLGGTGTVLFADNNVFNALVVIGGNPTIGPNITIHGAVGSVAGSFTNQATITADGSGSQITVIGTWVNQGVIEATGGSTLTLNGTWSNTGTIGMVDSTLNLAGAFSLSGLGALSRSGGTVNLRGMLTNDGTLALDDTTGSWFLQGSTIIGGRITTSGSGILTVAPSLGTFLNGVTLAGVVDVTDGTLFVTNGLTLDDGVINIAFGHQLNFLGTQTLGGRGTVLFDTNLFNAVVSSGTLTIGPEITIAGAAGVIGGSFINQGTITAGVQMRIGDSTWINQGVIEGPGATIALRGSWSNTGTIRVVDSTLDMGGTFRLSDVGTLERSGGEINLTGTVTNDGTLALDDNTGSWIVRNGTIIGGRITTAGSAKLLVGNSTFCFLNGVALAGTMDLTLLAGAQVVVSGNLTLDGGVIELARGNSLTFNGTQSLNGAGLVLFSDNALNSVFASSGTLTIGPSVTIRGIGGQVGASGTTFINQGTIAADGGGSILVRGMDNFSGGTFSGGAWKVVGNSTMFLFGANVTTHAADILIDGPNARLLSDGTPTSVLAGLSSITAAGRLTIRNGANLSVGDFDNAGALVVGPGSTFTAGGDFSASGVTTVDGSLVVPTVTVTSSGTLSGSGTVNGNVLSDGQVNPGSSPGRLTLNGDYVQSAAASLNIEIGGTTPASQYDRLSVTGSANLSGTLNVSLTDGFGPAAGQTFTVMNFASHSGTFDAINLPQIAGEPAFDVNFSATSLVLSAGVTAPNLVPETFTLPPGGSPGELVSIPYTVHNASGTPATGDWVDSFYLSRDTVLDANDPLLGRVQHLGGIAAFSSYSGTLESRLPGLRDGNYRVIVVVDSRGIVPDSDRANNTAVSADSIAITVPALTLGAATSSTIAAGQNLYFRVNAEPGLDFTIAAEFSTSPQAELYVRYRDVPSRSTFDRMAADVLSLEQELLLENPAGGAYYILLHGREGAGTGQTFTIRAAAVPFAIRGISPGRGSNVGSSTIALDSSTLTTSATVALRSSGVIRPATNVSFVDSSRIFATFDLTGLTPGDYDVQLDDTGRTATLVGAFQVTDSAPGQLFTRLSSPAFLRPGRVGRVLIDYINAGDTDRPAPLLVINAQNAVMRLRHEKAISAGTLLTTTAPSSASFAGGKLQLLGINHDGPAGVLPPGYHGTITLEFLPKTSEDGARYQFDLRVVDSPGDPVNWDEFKEPLRPRGMPDDAWNAIFAGLTARMGGTLGEYQAMLGQAATYLSRLGEATADVLELLAFEIQKAAAAAPAPTLGAVVDFSLPAPGLPLEFHRAFTQPLSGRYRLGMLGRGWKHSWEMSATEDAAGKVTIQLAGGVRTFVRHPDGSYDSSSGGSQLTRPAGGYHLLEPSGQVLAFLPDGRFDYIEDRYGNRITAGYTGTRLTSLTHSSGDALVMAYNAQGQLIQITDSAGRNATYSYDTSGEHLVGVSSPVSTTQYAYVTGQGAATEHALASITYTDGSQDSFEYDSQGRLIRSSRDGGTWAMSYSYGPSGELRVTDAEGRIFTYLLNHRGQVAQVLDPAGRVALYTYDADGRMIRSSMPDSGATTAFGYNTRGNLTELVDTLGNRFELAYDQAFNRLARVQDARGNITTHGYDTSGNLNVITYADGSSEQFTYDSRGKLTRHVNRLGQAINYTYDARGLMIRKAFSDGSQRDFSYDAQGNLLTAADAQGTISMEHDTANRLTKITYPTGRFLEFAYDERGRRTRSIDQDGFVTNYHYDAAGQLARISDGQGQSIVAYAYDLTGRLTREDRGNGTATTYEYDASGQLVHLVHLAPDGAVTARFDYVYDQLGLLSAMTTLEGTTSYGYDALGQLVSVTLPDGQTIAYEYDAMGNRITTTASAVSTSYAANNLNQYTTVGTTAQVYDAAGKLVSQLDGGDSINFAYNAEGRLTSVVSPTGTWIYEYDALGNRVAVEHDGVRTEYLIDPAGLGFVSAEYDDSGSLIAHYTLGLGLASRVDAGGATAYYHFDAVGNTALLTGANDAILNTYSYQPFGEPLAATGTTPNPFTFVGRYGVTEEGDGRYFMRARFYDSNLGRFMQPDPIGMAGGDFNLYRYAVNNPVSRIDPSGLDWESDLANSDTELPSYPSPAPSCIVNGTCLPTPPTPPPPPPPPPPGPDKPPPAPCVGASCLPPPPPPPPPCYSCDDDPPPDDDGPSIDPCFQLDLLNWQSQQTGNLGLYHFTNSELDCDPEPGPDPDPDDDGPGPGGGGPGGGAGGETRRPRDPNEIIGPAGFGTEGFLAPDQTLDYTIYFENKASAGAAAQEVIITQQLDADLDFASFELGDFGFGDITVHVPSGRSTFSTRVDARVSVGLFVDLTADLNPLSGLVTWRFVSIDPVTFDLPSDALAGFLPPNVAAPAGEGFVSYRVRSKSPATTGIEIRAVALIVFDTNDPIATNQVDPDDPSQGTDPKKEALVTLDVGPPSSRVHPLPAFTNFAATAVSWSGSDDADGTPGSGVASFDIFVSDNGGPFTLWLDDTTATSAVFPAQEGHTYAFYSVAKDNVGHVERTPAAAQASATQDASGPQLVHLDFVLQKVRKKTTVTGIRLQVDEAIDPAGAVDLGNFSVTVPTKSRKPPKPIPFARAEYDPLTNSVTLVSVKPLKMSTFYQITARSTLTDAAGNSLDGNRDGTAGDDLVQTLAIGAKLKYVDASGDTVSMGLKKGLVQLSRASDGEGERLLLMPTGPNALLSGTVKRPKSGGAALTTFDTLAVTAGPQFASTLKNPPFRIGPLPEALIDELLTASGGTLAGVLIPEP